MFNVEDYFDADDNTDDNFDTYADADAVAERLIFIWEKGTFFF